jgi:mannose-6-phosphate isomerase
MFRLSNAVRDYAWGSTTRLAEFLGRAPSGRPEAELWIGAHEGDPSRLPDGRSLSEAIAEAPQEMLGGRVSDIFGDRLPFLMKVLAVDQPLSLQVHPSSERARVGHARENDEGIPVGAPTRSYQDPWHKPELLFALTRFEGMAGFPTSPARSRCCGC